MAIVRRIVLATLVICLLAATGQASAASTVTAPYESKGESTWTVPDLSLQGTSDATATASVNGALSASAQSQSRSAAGTFYRLPSGYDPVFGQIKYGGQYLGVGGTSARGAASIENRLYVGGPGTYSISAQITSVTHRSSFTRTGTDPVTQFLADGYAWAKAAIYIVYFPCDVRIASCYASPNFQYIERDAKSASAGSLSVAGSYSAPTAGTFRVTVVLFAETSAKGAFDATASVSGTVSSITLTP